MTDTDDTTPKFRTVTLTGQAPVRIREDLWPTLASGHHRGYSGNFERPSMVWKASIVVRQHADGRTLVYGVADFESEWANFPNYTLRAGELYQREPSALAENITVVGEELTDHCDEGESGDAMRKEIEEAVRECIADLPPVDLD